MNEWLLFSFIFLGILSVLGASELIRNKFKKPPDSTRQFIHICVGIVVSICPFIFKVNYQLITLSLLFIIINIGFNLFSTALIISCPSIIKHPSPLKLTTVFFG